MIISIEGNIGSGKSTFCKYLMNNFSYIISNNIHFVDEPVKDWESIQGPEGNLLECFYKDQEKYAYCFQMTAYISRLANLKKVLKKCSKNDVIITERCVLSDFNVFAKMLKDSGKINEVEFKSYVMWFNHFIEDIPEILFVYIKTDYNNCYDRVIKRSRTGEESVTKEYLHLCEKYHEEWLNKENNKIILNGNEDTSVHYNYMNELKKFIIN